MLQLISFPGQILQHRNDQGGLGFFDLALLVLLALWFLTAQISLILLWKSVNEMQSGTFYSEVSIRRLDLLVRQFKIAIVIAITLMILVGSVADDPAPLVILTAVTLFLATLTLISSLVVEQLRIHQGTT